MSMDFTAEFEKNQNKLTEAEQAKKDKQANEPSLTEILADNEKSTLFLICLEEQGEQELATNLLTGELSAADRAVLGEKRRLFLDRLEKAQNLQNGLGQYLEDSAKVNTELKKEADTAGTDVLRKVLVDKAISRSFRDPAWMESMSGIVEGREARKEAIAKNNKLISEYCQKHNIKEEEFAATLAVDGEGNPDALKQLVKDKMGIFTRIFTSDRGVMRIVGKLDQREAMKENLAAVNKDLNELGGALRETLLKDPQAEEALAAYIVGESPKKTDGSFQESKTALKEFEIPTKEASRSQTEWNEKKAKGLTDIESFDIDRAYESFIDKAAEDSFQNKMGKGKPGFWATIFKLIMGKKLEAKIEK